MSNELSIEINGNAENCGRFIQQMVCEQPSLFVDERGWLVIPADIFQSLQNRAAIFDCSLTVISEIREAA
jgi:hypothetical protein